MTAPDGLTAPAIHALRADRGSPRGRNNVALPPASMAARGPATESPTFPLAINMRQPAFIEMRAAASLVTIPPELYPAAASPAIASISGPISETKGMCRAAGSLRGSVV